jgi:hypothetical protein
MVSGEASPMEQTNSHHSTIGSVTNMAYGAFYHATAATGGCFPALALGTIPAMEEKSIMNLVNEAQGLTVFNPTYKDFKNRQTAPLQ